ncbi:MAG TPA: ROK family protein [Mycobacteriales bacterium]|nr:ROK family protein [Mycobacteriales bacterium]
MAAGTSIGPGARPALIRELNERLILDEVRRVGAASRADLVRVTGLSKPTVTLALANLQQDGLIRVAGRRSGVSGPAALLHEVQPDAGYALALDVGREFVRGAIADMSGTRRAAATRRTSARTGPSRAAEAVALGRVLAAEVGISLADITQTVVGSPGVLDPNRDAITLARSLPGWERPEVLDCLREAFGETVVFENDVDAAAIAEREHGHGRDVESFAFLSIGTGIGMGLVVGGKLHRGAHGAAGEIAYLPISDGLGADLKDARRRGPLEAAASAAAIVRAARRVGMPGALSARRVFAAAAAGDRLAGSVVAEEAHVVARAICAVVAVADPALIVLGGGVGQAPGFAAAVATQLRAMSPVVPDVRVSALGDDAVVDGCLAEGMDRAWALLTAGGR